MNGTALTTPDEIKQWYAARPAGPISFDTETDSLRIIELNCTGISLCKRDLKPCYIDLRKGDRKLLLYTVSSILNNSELVIMHNAPFDMSVMMKEGFEITSPCYDTITAIHLLNETMEWRELGLKGLAVRLLHVSPNEVITFKRIQLLSPHSEQFYIYGRNDAKWAYQIFEMTDAKLTGKLRNLMYKVEIPFQKVLARILMSGITVDTQRLSELSVQVTDYLHEIEMGMLLSLGLTVIKSKNLWGEESVVSPINFNSTKEVILAVKRQLGIDIPFQTEKGNTQLDDYVLIQMSPKHEFFKQMRKYRELHTLKKTFVDGIGKKLDKDGKIRADLLNFTTVTGRLSCRNPNLENLPKPGENYKINFRNVFVASKGFKLIAGDYSGEELRVTADLSRDKNLVNTLDKNKDIHLSIVNSWYKLGVPEEALYESHPDYKSFKKQHKAIRDKLKIAFPILYGTTATGLAANSGISVEEAQNGIDTFFGLYPDVKVAIDNTIKEVFNRGYIELKSGRRRRFKKEINYKGNLTYSSSDFRQAFNFKIQGLSSDILRVACIKLLVLFLAHPEWEVRFLMLVHDEVLVEAREQYAQTVANEMKNVMENCVKLSVALPVDMWVGDRYGKE